MNATQRAPDPHLYVVAVRLREQLSSNFKTSKKMSNTNQASVISFDEYRKKRPGASDEYFAMIRELVKKTEKAGLQKLEEKLKEEGEEERKKIGDLLWFNARKNDPKFPTEEDMKKIENMSSSVQIRAWEKIFYDSVEKQK